MSSTENPRASKGNLRKIRQSVCSQNAYPVQSTLSGCKGTCTTSPGIAGIDGFLYTRDIRHNARHPASCTTSLSYEICQRTLSYTALQTCGTTRFRKSECKGTLFIRTGKTFHDIFSKNLKFSKISNFLKWRQNREEANTPIHYYNI